MNIMVRFLLRIALGSVLLSFLMGSSNAKVTTSIFNEDFSSISSEGGFPPPNWSTDNLGIWYGSSYGVDNGTGDGGFNGSAMFDMFDYCGSENLYSPQIDASAYGGLGATITLDFDYWWEQTYYDQNFGNNTITIFANDGLGNQIQVAQLFNNSDHTFSSGNFSENYYDPITNSSYWNHKTFTIPAAFATSQLQIVINGDATGVCNGGGNFGIDNVVVTGTIPQYLTYSPANLDFKTAVVGTQSAPQCITLTNISSADVSINQISIVGTNPNEFQLSGSIPSTVPANSTANICVIFVPLTTGTQTASLHITDNSDNASVIDLPLTGIGFAPLIEIDPIGLKNTSTTMFKGARTTVRGMLQQSLLIKNIGLSNLVVDPASYLAGANPNQYRISRIPINPIPPGQSDTLSVLFTPQMEGPIPAKLYILSNALNTIPAIDLFGTGIIPKIVLTPNIINFDSVGIGSKVCQNITIFNPGSDTLMIKRNYLSSNDGDFILTGLTTEQSAIPPDHSKTVSICFAPLQQGQRQSRYTIVTNIPQTFDNPPQDSGTYSVDITGTGVPFGKISFGTGGASKLDSSLVGTQVCQTATITNSGQADLTVTSATISGAQASDFALSGVTLPLHIAAQSSITVNICATPDIRGVRQAILTVAGTTNDHAINNSIPLAVFGEIACASPNPLALFNAMKVVKNDLDTQSVVITNCGDLPATYNATVSGDGYSILSPAGGTTGTVAPGGTVTYQVLFNPSTTGVKNGSLVVSSSNIGNITIPLTGEGACATLTEQTPNVPSTGVGASNTFDVTINNAGNYDWTPGSAVLTPSDVYTIISVTPSPIPAGGTGDVKIQFSPKAIGTATAQLTFPNAGPCQDAAVVINLSGEGVVNSVAPSVSADGISLGQNYPNPFVNTTTFNYSLPKEAIVRITLSDMKGNIVKTLTSGAVSEGDHSLTFDASQLSSGTYIYTLESGATRLSKVLVLSK